MRRLPVYIVLDTSIYMTEKLINLSLDIIRNILNELKNISTAKPHISIITFNTFASQIIPLTDISFFMEPKIFTRGDCKTGEALKFLEMSMEKDIRKEPFTGDMKPFVFLISGGKPSDDWQEPLKDIRDKCKIFAIIEAGKMDIIRLKSLTDGTFDIHMVLPEMMKKLFILEDTKCELPSITSSSQAQFPGFEEKKAETPQVIEQTPPPFPIFEEKKAEQPKVINTFHEQFRNEQYPQQVFDINTLSFNNELQKMIDSTPDGGVIKLFPGEYEGPVLIKKPLTIDGKESTLWSLSGPVMVITSNMVKLKDLNIEVTGDNNNPAIILREARMVEFENITVKGNVSGIPGEEGAWLYPHSLHIGELPWGKEHDFIIEINVPVQCSITSNIAGLSLNTEKLGPGKNEIKIHMDELPKDTLIHGNLTISSPKIKRNITVTACIMPA